MRWLKHAFAVDPPGPAEPTPEQRPAIDWVCGQIAKRHLTTPGLIALEMGRPLNYIFSMGLHATSPFVWAIARQQTHDNYRHFATFMEQRGSIEYLARRVEAIEAELAERRRQARERAGAEPRPEEEHGDDRP